MIERERDFEWKKMSIMKWESELWAVSCARCCWLWLWLWLRLRSTTPGIIAHSMSMKMIYKTSLYDTIHLIYEWCWANNVCAHWSRSIAQNRRQPHIYKIIIIIMFYILIIIHINIIFYVRQITITILQKCVYNTVLPWCLGAHAHTILLLLFILIWQFSGIPQLILLLLLSHISIRVLEAAACIPQCWH